jgi:hypothetical protein
MGLKEMRHERLDWIKAAQNRIQWWVLVNMLMNLLFP